MTHLPFLFTVYSGIYRYSFILKLLTKSFHPRSLTLDKGGNPEHSILSRVTCL